MSHTFATLVDSIGWALIHFLWQGVFIAFIAWIGLSIARAAKAETRYAILCLAMFACCLIPLASVVLDLSSGIEAPRVNMQAPFVPKDSAQWIPSFGLVAWLQRHLMVVVICWFFLTSILSMRFCLGLWWLYVTAGATQNSNNEYWQQKIETMACSVGIRARVVLRVVLDLHGPVTLGSLRPVILVLAALVIGMDARYLEALLAHEIAHI